jgi:hypothetical protein
VAADSVENGGCPYVVVKLQQGRRRGEADEGGVVFLAFGSFAVVVGAAGWVGQCGERGQEERPFEFSVAGSCRVLAFDRGAGAAGDRGDAGVGG